MNYDNSSGTISFNGDYTINLIGNIPITTSNVTITGGDHNINMLGPSGGSMLYLRSNGNHIDHLTMTNPNGYGIYIQDDQAADPSRLGSNNVIDHVTFLNSYAGIMIMGDSTDETTTNDNTIQNSLFGTTETSPTHCVTGEGNRFGIMTYFTHDTSILNNQIVCGIDNIDYNADGIKASYDHNLTISGNTIAGNEEYGIYTEQTDTGTITGNTIGNQGGTAAFPNGSDGIRLTYNSNNITIGGGNPADTNIISGNTGVGIYLDGYSSPIYNVTIDGNLIGLDTNHNPLPNAKGIVTLMSNHITIGSNDHTLVQQFISGNTEDGIAIIKFESY